MMQRLRELWRRLLTAGGTDTHQVFRNMLVLAAGSGAARLVGLLSVPIITRLYTPEQYGLFTLFLSATALIAPLASLRYAAALPLPRHRRTAAGLLLGCFGLLAVSLGLLTLLFALYADRLFALVSASALAPAWPLLVAAVGTAGLYEILTNWTLRRRTFRAMAQAEVSQSLIGGGLKIGLAMAALQNIGLVAGHLVAQLAAAGLLARVAWRDTRSAMRRANRRMLMVVLARYADFPKFRMPSQLLLIFSQQAPVFFVGALYGPATAGQLGLALVTLAVPLTLIAQTTGQAFYSEIAKLGPRQPEAIERIARGVIKRQLVLGLVPTGLLMGGATWIFPLLFGPRWHDAGVFASILSVYLLSQFVVYPLVHVLSVFDRNPLYLRLSAVRAALIAGVFALAHGLNLPPFMAIGAYSVVVSGHYALTSYNILAIIRSAVAEARSSR